MSKTIKGKTIVSIRTMGSMYDGQCITLTDNKGTNYRMKVEELLPLLKDITLDTEKKRVHTYLTIKTK